MNPTTNESENALTIERHGNISVVVASPVLQNLEPAQADSAASLILEPFRTEVTPQVVIDLARVDSFGSAFLAILIRLWKLVSTRGGTLVVCGLSPTVRELLRITSLDLVWPIYDNRAEAFSALISD